MSEIKDEIREHEYDGIREYNNPLPLWWLVTFFATIFFAFIYYIHYELSPGTNQYQELEAALARIEGLKQTSKGTAIVETEEDLEKMMSFAGVSETGSRVYAATCSACHGVQLQGMIGPNLTDKFWLHGKGTRVDLVHLIRKGIPEKGMPAWEEALKTEEVLAVAAFVKSKIGSQPENPKAPQGEPVE